MKDKIIQLLKGIIGIGLLSYIFYLYNQGVTISSNIDNNVIMFGLLLIIGVFITLMGIYPLCIKKARYVQFFLGIILIMIGHYSLKDDPSKYVFIADIIKILGVFLSIAGPIGICVPEKCKKKEEDAKIEIIEV